MESLRSQVSLLHEFYNQAFQNGDEKYFGEIAGKLRLLVYEGGRNKPLLLSLMDECEIEIQVVLNGPPVNPLQGQPKAGDKISLRQYLNLFAIAIRTPSNELAQLTKKELIAKWSQQHGSAHHDWVLDEDLASALNTVIFIGGIPALAAELKVTTETVLHVANTFLNKVEK